MGPFQNLLILMSCLALTAGGGTYLTFFQQPEELEAILQQEREIRQTEGEVAELLAVVAETKEKAELRIAQWETRYKIIPETRQTTEVLAYLNRLTETGFRQFDVTYEQLDETPDYNTHIYDVKGRAFFGELYGLVWALENHRDFYRVEELNLNHFDLTYNDPVTGRPKMDVLVSFAFKLHAYYGGKAGLSADDPGIINPDDVIRIGSRSELPPVPPSVLPDLDPAKNPFAPLILAAVPPNTDGLPEIENAALIAITGGKAVFNIMDELVTLGIGDPVYLGQIVSIDPRSGSVIARLNKGGIIDEIEIVLQTGESFRQAVGPQDDPVLITTPKTPNRRNGR